MKQVTVKLPAKPLKTQFGRLNGRVEVRFGEEERQYDAKTAKDDALKDIVGAMQRPRVALVTARGLTYLIVSHNGCTEIYRPMEEGEGVRLLTCTTVSWTDLREEADRTALHIAQSTCTDFTADPPEWLPESMHGDYLSWRRLAAEQSSTR